MDGTSAVVNSRQELSCSAMDPIRVTATMARTIVKLDAAMKAVLNPKIFLILPNIIVGHVGLL